MKLNSEFIKWVVFITLACFLASVIILPDKETVTTNTDITYYCDKSNNVEYLIYSGYKSGGMSVRYNNDGSITKCSVKDK